MCQDQYELRLVGLLTYLELCRLCGGGATTETLFGVVVIVLHRCSLLTWVTHVMICLCICAFLHCLGGDLVHIAFVRS